jgi:AhpD family alkylhydroperoxidase
MTTAEATETARTRLDFKAHATGFYRALGHLDQAATKELEKVDFDVRLRELVRIRASQLNGCAFCIDMHTKDARVAGETEQRIYALSAWRETPFFTSQERAALALTESVTLMPQTHVPDADFAQAAGQFSADELAALISLIVTINAWNAIGVSARAWVPGSYQP